MIYFQPTTAGTGTTSGLYALSKLVMREIASPSDFRLRKSVPRFGRTSGTRRGRRESILESKLIKWFNLGGGVRKK